MPKIEHFREKCIGCNSCVEHAPKFWQIKEDGKSTLEGSVKKKLAYVREIDDIDVEKNKLAAKDCPVNIIHVYE